MGAPGELSWQDGRGAACADGAPYALWAEWCTMLISERQSSNGSGSELGELRGVGRRRLSRYRAASVFCEYLRVG